jgi:hypothetical protein
MIRSVFGLLALLTASAPDAMAASDIDTLTENLEAHGFATCHKTGELRNCASAGTLPDGRDYRVNVFAAEDLPHQANNITVFIQPEDAITSKEVERFTTISRNCCLTAKAG